MHTKNTSFTVPIILVSLVSAVLIIIAIVATTNTPDRVYRDSVSGVSFSYPKKWLLDRSQASQGMVSLSSEPRDLNRTNSIGTFDIVTNRTNPNHLAPAAWIEDTFHDQVSEMQDMQPLTVGSYSAYRSTITEMIPRQHVFLFSGAQVIEAAFPTTQPNFQPIYDSIFNSIRFGS